MITFVQRDRRASTSPGAIEWLADRFRIPLEYEETRRSRTAAPATGGSGCYALLDQAATYYERTLWDSEAGGARPRLPDGPRARRGGLPRVPARARARRHRRSPARRREGLHRRGAPRGRSQRARGGDYFQRRLLFPLADARGRVVGFQARRLHEDDPLHGEVRQHARVGAVPQGRGRLRARQGARRDRPGGPRLRRRGEHRRARSPPGRVRACRRLHGHRAHRAAAHRARPAHEAALAGVRRRRRRRVGDAPRDGARRAPGLRREGRRAAARSRSRRRPGGVRGRARAGGAVSPVPRSQSRSLAPRTARPAFQTVKALLDAAPDSPENGRTRGATRTTGSA